MCIINKYPEFFYKMFKTNLILNRLNVTKSKKYKTNIT